MNQKNRHRLAAYRWLNAFGWQPRRMLRSLATLFAYLAEFRRFKANASADWPVELNYPCLEDRIDFGGVTSGHYFHQDFFVARRIFAMKPAKHVDVGSRIDGFITSLAVFREVEVFDLRAIESPIHNVHFRQVDITDRNLPLVNYSDSVSCLHVIEHLGLGRYGDRVDGDGWRLGFKNLSRLVSQGGYLFLSVPIGRQRVEFNAHRVFSIATILDEASRLKLCLKSFSYIDDRGELREDIPLGSDISEISVSLHYGCGIFEFRKN